MANEKQNIERRVFDFHESREFAPHIDGDGRRIVGYAIVFNHESRVLYDKASRSTFIEVIRPEAVNMDFLGRQDIKLNFQHNNDNILARSCMGFGSLSYDIDDYGVKFSCELPNSSMGNDVLEMIRRGDVFGCSFAFTYGKDGYKDVKTGSERYRYVTGFGSIDDFAIVVDPAYLGTMVTTMRAYEASEEDPEEKRGEEQPENHEEKPFRETAEALSLEMELLELEGIL